MPLIPMLEKARFHLGAASLSQLPRDSTGEVALAGRSNAGKSSALNALTNRRKLAFVSKTPGRTQQINYYSLARSKYLVDLPGYGYAKVSATVQRSWQQLLGGYLRERNALEALVVIMDVRHPLTVLDRELLDWFSAKGKPVLLLLTKADKLSRQQQERQLLAVRKEIEGRYPTCTTQLFSSVSGMGLPAARAFIERALHAPTNGSENGA